MKMIGKAFDSLDSAVMKSVNTGVKAYNRTIGETKIELVNGLLTAAAIVESISFLAINLPFGLIFCPFSISLSHMYQKMNNFWEAKEVEAIEKKAKDFFAELIKDDNKIYGYLWWSCSCAESRINNSTNYLPIFILSARQFTRGTAHQVMRAEYLPLRKNCISRGLEKLAEWYSAAKAEPALAHLERMAE